MKLIGRNSPLQGALVKSLEGLWGFGGDEPGVRHGGPVAPAADPAQVRYVIEACACAVRLLVTLE